MIRRYHALSFAILAAGILHAADAGGGGAGGNPPPNPNPAADPNAAGKQPPPTPAPAAETGDQAFAKLLEPFKQTIAGLETKIGGLETKLTAAEKRDQDRQVAAENTQAAKASGAKDADYFTFLANQERQAKGDKFSMEGFVTDLKAKKAELFNQPDPAVTTGAPPALPADKADGLKAQYKDALARGRVQEALKLQSQLLAAGIKV